MKFSLLVVSFVSLVRANDLSVSCARSDSQECHLSGIHFHPNFSIVTDDSQDVTKLRITESVLESWSPVFCSTFPNLKEISAGGQGILALPDGALDSCLKLESLDFSSNNLTLGPATFRGPRFLKILVLSSNSLKELPTEAFRSLHRLRKLDVSSNRLFDVDIESILKTCLGLEEVDLRGNPLRCERAAVIVASLARENILVDKDSLACLTNQEWIRRLRDETQWQLLAQSFVGRGTFFDVRRVQKFLDPSYLPQAVFQNQDLLRRLGSILGNLTAENRELKSIVFRMEGRLGGLLRGR